MKDYLVKYYDSTRQYYGTYHNHKEVSAWAGLALHVLFCGVISAVKLPDTSKMLSAMGITLAALISAILAYRYIHTQLQMKDRGGALAAAATYLLVEILQKGESELKASDYLAMQESVDTKAQSAHVHPVRLLKKADVLDNRGRGFQDATKRMTYGLLVLSTFSVLCLKFICVFG